MSEILATLVISNTAAGHSAALPCIGFRLLHLTLPGGFFVM